jgi:putative tricarboxylic transport membrane protein
VTQAKSDRLAGTILLLVAVLWIAGCFWTIPEVAGGARVGPRGFPLAMGVALAALSLALIVSSCFSAEALEGPEGAPPVNRRIEAWALVSTFGFLALYVLLLDLFGFLLATIAATALFLVGVVDKRSPKLVALVSLGLAFGVWLILGKAMGVYLPRGSIIDWF